MSNHFVRRAQTLLTHVVARSCACRLATEQSFASEGSQAELGKQDASLTTNDGLTLFTEGVYPVYRQNNGGEHVQFPRRIRCDRLGD